MYSRTWSMFNVGIQVFNQQTRRERIENVDDVEEASEQRKLAQKTKGKLSRIAPAGD